MSILINIFMHTQNQIPYTKKPKSNWSKKQHDSKEETFWKTSAGTMYNLKKTFFNPEEKVR